MRHCGQTQRRAAGRTMSPGCQLRHLYLYLPAVPLNSRRSQRRMRSWRRVRALKREEAVSYSISRLSIQQTMMKQMKTALLKRSKRCYTKRQRNKWNRCLSFRKTASTQTRTTQSNRTQLRRVPWSTGYLVGSNSRRSPSLIGRLVAEEHQRLLSLRRSQRRRRMLTIVDLIQVHLLTLTLNKS